MNQLSLDFSINDSLLEGLNPQQQQAVMAPLQSAVQVMAGAGTGKTKLISHRFAKLALDLRAMSVPAPTRLIWVSTFTEKAAQEMKTRIAEFLTQFTGIALDASPWIGTFHALCFRLLQSHGDKTPHLDGLTLLNEIELEIIKEGLVKTLLMGEIDALPAYLEAEGLPISPAFLSPEHLIQLEIPDFEKFFTEVLFSVIPRIKASGLSPKSFYHQALHQAKAYARLISQMPNADADTGMIWTEHEAFAHAWHQHLSPVRHDRFHFLPNDWFAEIEAQKALAKRKDPPSALAILKETLKPFLKANCFVGYNGRKKKEPFSAPTTDFSVLNQALALEIKVIEIVSAVYALYQQVLRAEKVCDFDDLIQESIQLLETCPDIRQYYQQHFAHLMVDEFQDSNGGQLQLIQLLSGEQDPHITVVGDKKQSIYGFRFAEPENLQLLFQDIPNAQAIHLQTNYRSKPAILAMANRITQMMALEVEEFLEPCEANSAQCTEQAEVTWLHLADVASVYEAKLTETQWISQSIADLLKRDAYTPSDIAVLVRDHQKALQIEEALAVWGIPAVRQRNLGFFENPVVRQAVAFLELAENPHNDLALINLLQRKLSHRELYQLAKYQESIKTQHHRQDVSYFDTLQSLLNEPESGHSLEYSLPLLAFVHSCIQAFHLEKLQKAPDELFSWMKTVFPLVSPAEMETHAGQKNDMQLILLEKMLKHWVEHSPKSLNLANILDFIRRSQEKNTLDLPFEKENFMEHAVRIMTVHGSKGLEFPVVFLAAADTYRRNRTDGLLTVDPQYPGKMGVGLFLNKFNDEKTLKKLIYDTVWKIPRNQEEELRLFYVGVTRAKSSLFVSSWSQTFPYMNPAFFQDLSLCILSPDDVDWKSESERLEAEARFRNLYWKAFSRPENTQNIPVS